MTGIRRLVLTLTALSAVGLHGQDLSAVSGANCTFKQNPAKFQGQTGRSIRAIADQLSALSKSKKAMSAVTLDSRRRSACKLHRRSNFSRRCRSRAFSRLRIAGDEEFFRRINLDLTGRIPAPADIQAFEGGPDGEQEGDSDRSTAGVERVYG